MRFGGTLFLIFISLNALGAKPPFNVEEETLHLSKRLKPVPNEEWLGIAGNRISESYEVSKGDTLWDVSGRLFGDSHYWPKIWSINNGSILNPHLIHPGKKVVFLPGSETQLPGVQVVSASDVPPLKLGGDTSGESGSGARSNGEPIDPATIPRSSEWQSLPRQSWERGAEQIVPKERELTIEERAIEKIRAIALRPDIRELASLMGDQPPASWGEVIGSRTQANLLSVGDILFIRSPYDLQTGRIYTAIGETKRLRSSLSDRITYLSPILSTIKIIGIRDGVFVAAVLDAKEPISRGDRIVEYIPPVPIPRMIQGSSPIEGLVLSDTRELSRIIAQERQYYIDRGLRDGIRPGMVFRTFQHRDPSSGKKISDANFLVDSDFLVLKSTDLYSTLLCLSGEAQIGDQILANVLLDISDAGSTKADVRSGGKEETEPVPALKNLDDINEIEGIGHEEQKELEQIEALPSDVDPGSAPPPLPPGAAPDASSSRSIEIPNAPLEPDALPPPPGYDVELDAPYTPPKNRQQAPLPPKYDPELDAPMTPPSTHTSPPAAPPAPRAITPSAPSALPSQPPANYDVELDAPSGGSPAPGGSSMPSIPPRIPTDDELPPPPPK